MKRNLVIETMGACNLKCYMCPTVEYTKGKHIIKDETFEYVVEYIEKYPDNIEAIDMTGWGEPFLDKKIFDKIKKIKKKNPNIKIYIISNGTLINEDIINKINDTKIDHITISFDGASAETYNKIRENADFNDVIPRLKLLSSKKTKNTTLTIASVIMKANISEIEEQIKLFDNLEFDNILFKPLNVISSLDINKMVVGKNTILDLINKINGDKYKINILTSDLKENVLEKNCLANSGEGQVFINSNGDVAPCCNLGHHVPVYKKNFFYKNSIERDNSYFFGNINDASLKDILETNKYKSFLNTFQKGILPQPCHGCNLVGKKLKRTISTKIKDLL